MSNTKGSFQEQVERAVAVGWPVRRQKNGHWFIQAPNGKGESFPSTPNSGRGKGIMNAKRWLERNGILEAEERLREENEKKRKTRMVNDQRTGVNFGKPAPLLPPEKPAPGPTSGTNKDYINGVRVAERQPARWKTPIMQEPKEFHTVDEVLLVDGTVLYQCTSCLVFTSDNPRSVHSHSTNHQARKTAQIRRAAKAVTNKTTPTKKVTRTVTVVKPKQLTPFEVRLIDLEQRVRVIADEVDQVAVSLKDLASDLKSSVPDPETIEKAKAYDQLKALMNK